MLKLNPTTNKLDLTLSDAEVTSLVVESVDELPDPAVSGKLVKLTTDKRIYFGLES